MFAVAAHIRPLDLRTRQRIDVRVGSAPPGAALGTGGFEWQPAIGRRPTASLEIMPLDLARGFKVPSGDLTLNLNEVLGFNLNQLHWLGAPITIYRIDDLSLYKAPVELTGVLNSADPDIIRNTLTLGIEGTTAPIDKPLLWLAFDGSGGAGGDPEKRGVLKPAGFGLVNNVEPVWFDENRSIGMLDGYGNLAAVSFLGEGRSSWGPPKGDYASYADLAAALDGGIIAAGQWATCLAEGMVGLGAPATGVITCDCEFGFGMPGALILRALTFHAKIDPENIVVSSLDNLDAIVARRIHYHTATQRTVLDLVEALVYQCNATPVITMRGKIGVVRALGGPLIGTVRRQGFSEPTVTQWRGAPPILPTWQLVGRAGRPARVLERSEMLYADDITGRGRYNADETYRQGQTVFLRNGSEWLYINEVASSGHAPPDPLTSDQWWRQLQPAMVAGDITYDDGTTLQANQPAEPDADITKSLDLATSTVVFQVDGSGAIVAGQLPYPVRATRRRGGIVVSKSTAFSITMTGAIQATVNDTPDDENRGVVTITSVQSSGQITVNSVRDGALLPATIDIQRPSAPPTSGGGEAGTGGSITAFATVGTDQYSYLASPPDGKVTLKSDANGKITATISVVINRTGSGVGAIVTYGKIMFRPVGATAWTDAAPETRGEQAYRLNSSQHPVRQGSLNTGAIVITGTASTDYEVAPFFRKKTNVDGDEASDPNSSAQLSGTFNAKTGL